MKQQFFSLKNKGFLFVKMVLIFCNVFYMIAADSFLKAIKLIQK